MNVYQQRSPWEQNWERLVTDSLMANTLPASILRTTRPPLPQVADRPKFGWPSKQEREMGIRQILDVPRLYADRRFDTSGGPGGYQGSERNVNQSMSW